MIAEERIDAIRQGLTDALDQATELQDSYDDGVEVDGLSDQDIGEIRSFAWSALKRLPDPDTPEGRRTEWEAERQRLRDHRERSIFKREP